MSVTFTIDGEGEPRPVQISFGMSGVQLLRQTSPKLRRLIDDLDPHPPRVIPLSENKDEYVDVASIRYLLENIRMSPEERQRLRVANLSQLCNALYYYRCSPSPFLGLWDRLIQPWEVMPRPDGMWSWRIPRKNMSEKLKSWPNYPGHSANAAYVLEKDQEFSDVLRFIVWDSLVDAVPTAVEGLKATKVLRHRYMESLFCVMAHCIGVLNKEHHDISKQMQTKIDAAQNLNLHLAGSMEETGITFPWERSKPDLLDRTIYGFALQVDMALLNGTDLEYNPDNPASYFSTPTMSSSTSSSGPPIDSDATSVRGQGSFKSFNRLHFTQLIKRFKALFGQEDEYIEKVKKVLCVMDAQIRRDQEALIANLITARSKGYLGAAAECLPGGAASATPAPYMTPANGYYAPESSAAQAQYGDIRQNGQAG